MHFQKLFSIFALAATVLAAPAPNGGGDSCGTPTGDNPPKPTTPAGIAAGNCNAGQVLACCDTVLLGIGQTCSVIDLLNVAVLSDLCSAQVACCAADQNGLINVGNVCPIIL